MQRLPDSFNWLLNSFSRVSWSCGYLADCTSVDTGQKSASGKLEITLAPAGCGRVTVDS